MTGRRGTPAGWEVGLGFAAVYVLWGSTYLAIRYAVESLPPFLMAGTRHLTAGVMLYAYARRQAPAAAISARHWRSAAIAGILLLLGGNGLVSWAEQRVPSGVAALVVASVPLWMVVLAAAERRRLPGLPVVGGVLLGLFGLALLVLPGIPGGGGLDRVGVLVLLAASLSWSIGSLHSRRAPAPGSSLLGTAMQMLCGGAALWALGLLSGEGAGLRAASLTPRSLGALAYLVVFGSLLGFSAYSWLLRVSTPARVSTYAFVNPIVAVLFGWGLAGEALTPRMGMAAAAIVAAVVLILRYGSAAPPASGMAAARR